MGGYRDEYEEDLDEYEDEEAEGGEGYEGYEDEYEEGYEEEEEDPLPPKEVQDYLVLRQRLKEEKRKQLKKELGTGGNVCSREKNNSILKSNDNYGSFFGSSQPIIAQRVIQESKSLLENPHLLDKAIKPKNTATKSTFSDSVSSKSQGLVQTPKVVNVVHKKVQMIKKIRDYSFLDSEDPEPPKDYPRTVHTQKSEARTTHSSERRKDVSSSSNGRNDKKSTPVNGHLRPNVPNNGSRDHRFKLPVNNGTITQDMNRVPNKTSSSGPGRPRVSKSVTLSKIPAGDKRVQPPPLPARSKSSVSLTHKTAPSRPHPPPGSKTQVPMPKQQFPSSKQSLVRREHEDLRKPKVLPKQSSHGAHDEPRKHKVLPKQSTVLEQKMLPKQSAREESRKPKVLPRQGGAPVLKPMPPPRSSARPMAAEVRSRKRPIRPRDDEEDDPENVRNMIRSMFGYNPSRYGDDEDVSDMEANFEEIEREEKRSARIARKEDEEELRKIEEEEKRQRLRKEAKKRKLY